MRVAFHWARMPQLQPCRKVHRAQLLTSWNRAHYTYASPMPDSLQAEDVTTRDGNAWVRLPLATLNGLLDERFTKLEQETHQLRVELAQTHLDRVGRALLKGAKARAIPKEEALDVYVQKLGLDTDYYYLHFAWQLLGEDEIKKTRRPELRLKMLEAQLNDFPALLCRLGDRFHRGHNYPLPRIRLSNFILEQTLIHLLNYHLPDKLTQWQQFPV